MNKYEIVEKIERFAPLETQEEWDASGWIVDLKEAEVNKVLFALTITDDILEQAVRQGCNMIISHHPMFFVPWKYRNINIYCAHTNLDKATGGTTDTLLKALHLEGHYYNDFVRIVNLENELHLTINLLYRQLLYLNSYELNKYLCLYILKEHKTLDDEK